MANQLLATLRENDKNGLFIPTQTSIGYNTGFLPYDYKNGYIIQVRNFDDKLIKEYPSTGIVGGTFTTIIGKSGTAKTTFAVQASANIVKRFESGMVMHYDLEQALNYTRLKNVTGYKTAELYEKYILKQEKNFIEDIYDAILKIGKAKEENKKYYTYETGLMNEFNEPITVYVPTFIILDSIPSIASKEISKDEIEGSTYASRMAKVLSQWYKKLLPVIKTYNINIITINHINAKIDISAFQKSQPQLMYLKMDESVPGGNAPIYFAHQLLKFVSCGKYDEEKDGFDGFKVRCELLKSRTNKAGQFCNLVYNQDLGFDPVLTQLDVALENDLVLGKSPYRYFVGYKDHKFGMKDFNKSYRNDENIRKALFETTVPLLEKQLSRVERDDTNVISYDEVIERVIDSNESEVVAV
jgi:RecA/RadA recombinase